MQAHDLLRSGAPFIADTSAWWRVLSLPDDLATLVQDAVRDDRLWITPIVRMEILYSARTRREHARLEAELDALRIVRNDRAVADAAMRALSELAQRSDGFHPSAAHRRVDRGGRRRAWWSRRPASRCALRSARPVVGLRQRHAAGPLSEPGKRARARSKGGNVDWLFSTRPSPARAPAAGDICSHTGRARLSYRRAEDLLVT